MLDMSKALGVLTLFLKASKGNNLISKSRAFHNVGAAYTKDISKNELAHVLLIGETHNKQGSKDARVRIVVLLTLSLIKSHKYSGAVLLTALCVKMPSSIMKQCVEYYIKPLTFLINMSITQGTVPNELKIAKVIPLYKGEDIQLIENYRPISILPYFSKNF